MKKLTNFPMFCESLVFRKFSKLTGVEKTSSPNKFLSAPIFVPKILFSILAQLAGTGRQIMVVIMDLKKPITVQTILLFHQ